MDLIHLQLDTPRCPVSRDLEPGDRFACIGLGGQFGAYGLRCGDNEMSVQSLPYVDCSSCPLNDLERGARPLVAEAHSNGLRIQMLISKGTSLDKTIRRLRDAGHCPRVVSATTMTPNGGVFVPWMVMTFRQQHVLETAWRMGYFEPGGPSVQSVARAIGIGKSATHEHLQKGVAVLLAAMYQGDTKISMPPQNKRNKRPRS